MRTCAMSRAGWIVTLLVTMSTLVPAAARAQEATSVVGKVTLTSGRSTILTTDFDVTRIAVTNPAIADAVVVEPRELLIDGKTPGTVSLIIWGQGRRVQYDLAVENPVSPLQVQLNSLFPGEDIHVTTNEEATTISGRVSSNAVMLKVGEIAAKTSSKTQILNLLEVPGGVISQQVMLQVRFAEVNRQALTEAGVSLFTGTRGYKDFIGRVTAGTTAPSYGGEIGTGEGQLTFSDFLNLFLFNTKYDVGGLLKALQSRGFLQSLAEPNLIAYNGREASFLAGGEVPIPIVQSNAGGVTIEYKEFGIRLGFTPVIAGDMIRLRVRPEVSTLDFANGVTLSGFRIPALTTRRAETEVELRDGQSFAIAGLLNNLAQTDRQMIPVLSSLPIIGNLFKSKAARQERTELMVLITPRLVRPLDPDEVPPLPTTSGDFMPAGDGAGSDLRGGGGTVDAPALAGQQR